jgi:hypothetical protein
MTMSKELRYAFEDLKTRAGISEEAMIACWLEFIGERMRNLADSSDAQRAVAEEFAAQVNASGGGR